MPPKMYTEKPVKWVIELDADGSCLGVLQQTGDGRKGDRGKLMLVPDRTRSGTMPPPIFLADNAKYTFSFPAGDSKSAERHRWYCELTERASRDLDNPDLRAVIAFLTRFDNGEIELPPEMMPEDVVTFRITGRMPVDDLRARSWWAANWNGSEEDAAEVDGGGSSGQCIVCGQHGQKMGLYIPLKLKGLPGGQSSGTTLVSINADAFESFGLPRGLTSRVCRTCGETFMQCLNALLSDDQRHLSIGPLVYIFWTSGQAEFNPFSYIRDPDPTKVRELIESVRTGIDHKANTTQYHIAALSASAARAVLRESMDVSGPQLEKQIACWFELQTQVDPWGGKSRPLGVWRLAAAAYRDASKEMTPDVPAALMRCALSGRSLPPSLLPRVIQRCRADHDSADRPVTYERAVLIRTLLTERNEWKAGEMTDLDQTYVDPAYRSGRVLAVLEDIQRAALGKIGATVVDKYYGAASARPAIVLGKLIGDSQNHLGKLRKDKPGLCAMFQEDLEQALAGMDTFPRTLALERQGMFALGYYHQRAASRARMKSQDGRDNQIPEEE